MFKIFQDIFSKKNLLVESLEESWIMLEIDREMFDASVKSLREQDTADVEVDIYKRDLEVNRFEMAVRKKVLTHLSVSGPTDLSIGLTLVSIISDIERIGDYTKNIYELAKEHPTRLTGGPWEEELKVIERKVSESFELLVEALKESDKDKGHEIIQNLAKVKDQCDDYVMQLIKGKGEDLKTGEAVSLALYMRYLKRVSSHIQNITSSIVNPFHRLKYSDE